MTPFDLQTNDIKFSHSPTGSMSSAHVPPPVTTPAAHVHDPEYQNLHYSSNNIVHKYYPAYISHNACSKITSSTTNNGRVDLTGRKFGFQFVGWGRQTYMDENAKNQ